ncbi:DUF3800 domain-containing protein [Ralstonia pseudosolanacearum]|uniref:DUF3800 domain-containing protein n=1 Tax=Ralstonia pseudosolanacearum TaxID=1310165 RepID=UPI0020060813|nr:DUF3800 domain-containing protein [Ralstonia pseudosolanacearum]MCK4130181.1 DUF3800 domain-containing protein [Ralstonia pseudosolanacearum]
MHYIAYLDEFGHIGPFVSRADLRHNTSPVFGLGGFVLPSSKVRAFATWFYQLKCNLLQFEIARDGIPAYQWEKKGAALYTTKNVLKYKELRSATFRLMNRIGRDGGMVFYVGLQKTRPPESHNPKSLYRAVLRESIKRINQFCVTQDAHFRIILDELKNQDDFRTQIVSEASIQMFGEARMTMIEPPIQAESHLFQTLQCADWLCGLIGRVGCYHLLPESYTDLDWTEKYFVHRLNHAAPNSGIRRERPAISHVPTTGHSPASD